MEGVIFDKNGNSIGKMKVPDILTECKINETTIKKAFLADLSKTFQIHYPDPLAGTKKSVFWTKRRRRWKTVYRGDTSRTPAKSTWHSGNFWIRIGAFAPQTVGGREAHPPTPNKIIEKKINKKEKKKAILMCLSASLNKELVSKYHKIKDLNLPIILDDSIKEISKTQEMKELLEKIGLKEELERINQVKISSTKGKYRGRKYKKKAPLILITLDNSSMLKKVAKNLNVKVVAGGHLSLLDLTHAGSPGRLILWTKSALENLPIWMK
ncbi:MAG: 50S ribosomal protein L4 [Candidatus Rehaiarchaeum fermentans]|nr:50S ribosomal protein L4 [Candidatus Rehaiarchaeum fermentans]